MDLDLKIELRLGLRRRPLMSFIVLDEDGYWLEIMRGHTTVRLPLPDAMEDSILQTMSPEFEET